MTEQTNTPKLRFPEFKDEWKLQKLGNLAQFSKGKSLSKKDLNINGNPCILYGELYTKYGAILNKVYSKTSTQNDSLVFSKRNQILIPSSGETDIDIATATAIDTDVKIAIGGDLNIITPINSDGRFISLYINGKGKYNLAKYAQGKSVVHLYNSDIKKLNFYLPTNMAEQKKVGDFFSKLDRQIELEEQKLEKLEEQKKGYMQKIFSQELRFKDKKDNYYSDWKNCQLKDLTYYKNGKGYEKVATTNGKYNIINLNSIGIKGQLKNSGKYTDFEDDTLLKNDLIMILSDVAKGNLIGMTAIIDENNKYLLNQRIALLRIKNSLITNAYFLYLYINFNRKYFINMSAGMSQLNINKKTVEDFPVNLPNIEEQNKIAILFKNYGDTIKKQASKVKLLKQRKQGLLQKMFV